MGVALVRDVAGKMLEHYASDDKEEQFLLCLKFCDEILNFRPNIHQIFYLQESINRPYVVCTAPPRSGKTMAMEALDLYETACYPYEDGVIYAPKFDQAKDTLSYHYDWIEKSPVLKSFLRIKGGKRQFSSERYTFRNLSNWRIYSIVGEIEGHNVTIMRCEEFDDWKLEKFTNDVMRRGGAKPRNGKKKRIRQTGTIMGMENIYYMLNDPKMKELFFDLSTHPNYGRLDIYFMLANNVMDADFVAIQRETMSPDEWARSGLLLFTESRNFIWQSILRQYQKWAMSVNLEAVPYRPGSHYESDGRIAVGFDCGHAGSNDNSSVYSLQLIEEIRVRDKKYKRWVNAFQWPSTVSDSVLLNELIEIFSYYRPVGGYGDALKHNTIKLLNDMCYRERLTEVDADECPEHTQANWDKWYISPIWNSGKVKHSYYEGLQRDIHHGDLLFPYYDGKDIRHEAVRCHETIKSILNVRQVKNNSTYPSYVKSVAAIQDDDSDALGMANMWLNDHTDGWVDFGQFTSFGRREFKLGAA